MPIMVDLLAGGPMTVAEFRRFFGSGSLDLPGYFVLVGVVFVIAALCMITSRLGVFRILHTRQ
jgi:cell division transport system permease protein